MNCVLQVLRNSIYLLENAFWKRFSANFMIKAHTKIPFLTVLENTYHATLICGAQAYKHESYVF